MKTKSLGLLAITALALAMPFTASAAVSTIKVTDGVTGAIVVPTTAIGTSYTISPVLGDQYGGFLKVSNLTGGTYTYDTFFKVAAGVNTFSGTVNWIAPTVAGTVKLLQGSTPLSTFVDGKAIYTGLVAGTTYTLETIVSIKANEKGGFTDTFKVAAVPEPEEWAMMLVGAGLVSYQVRRKQKGLSQSTV
jgi:hypothetical protein